MKNVELTIPDIELIRHALYAHRETVRVQLRFALNEQSPTAKRDADRFNRIITASLKLDEKLSQHH